MLTVVVVGALTQPVVSAEAVYVPGEGRKIGPKRQAGGGEGLGRVYDSIYRQYVYISHSSYNNIKVYVHADLHSTIAWCLQKIHNI